LERKLANSELNRDQVDSELQALSLDDSGLDN